MHPMTPPHSIVGLTALSLGGFVLAAVAPEEAAIPWKDIGGFGGVGALLYALYLFLKFLREERGDRAAERQKDREHFEHVIQELTKPATEAAKNLGDTTRILMSQVQELVRDLKKT
jgi:hypothetical protein